MRSPRAQPSTPTTWPPTPAGRAAAPRWPPVGCAACWHWPCPPTARHPRPARSTSTAATPAPSALSTGQQGIFLAPLAARALTTARQRERRPERRACRPTLLVSNPVAWSNSARRGARSAGRPPGPGHRAIRRMIRGTLVAAESRYRRGSAHPRAGRRSAGRAGRGTGSARRPGSPRSATGTRRSPQPLPGRPPGRRPAIGQRRSTRPDPKPVPSRRRRTHPAIASRSWSAESSASCSRPLGHPHQMTGLPGSRGAQPGTGHRNRDHGRRAYIPG